MYGLSDDGIFSILKNDEVYKSYKVFVSAFNSKQWSNFTGKNKWNTYTLDITFDPIPPPERVNAHFIDERNSIKKSLTLPLKQYDDENVFYLPKYNNGDFKIENV
mgnify:CR=1 FL=1